MPSPSLLMAAINHGGTFYRLDKSSQSGDCGEANVMALHLASKQVMPFGYGLTQVKAQSNCIRAGSFSPFPSCHASGTPYGSSTASTHNPYKEVILSRRPFNEGVKGCTRGPPTPLRTCSPSHDPALKNKRPSTGTRFEQSLFL